MKEPANWIMIDPISVGNKSSLQDAFWKSKKTKGKTINGMIGTSNLLPQQNPPCRLAQKHMVRYQVITITPIILNEFIYLLVMKNIPINDMNKIGLKDKIPRSNEIK